MLERSTRLLRISIQQLTGQQARCRGFHFARPLYRSGNSLARYGRPPPADAQHIARSTEQDTQGKAFETASTAPAAASLQDVPPPTETSGTRLATPIPAMAPVEPDKSLAESKTPAEVLSGNTPVTVAGVTIPAKPIPPGEEECCMSGCVHCVYTIYADDLEKYTTAVDEAKAILTKTGVPMSEWPQAVQSLQQDAGGDPGVMKAKEEAKVVDNVDPAMAAFLAFEQSLKKKQAPTSSAAS